MFDIVFPVINLDVFRMLPLNHEGVKSCNRQNHVEQCYLSFPSIGVFRSTQSRFVLSRMVRITRMPRISFELFVTHSARA